MKQLYTVYDKVSQSVVGSIIQEASDAPAIRAFFDALRAKESPFAPHPADYNLLLIGTIVEDGTIVAPTDGPQAVATGEQWLAITESV